MEQLSLVPACDKHGCEKVWIKDRHRKQGGFFRCRECNRLSSLERNVKNRANPDKTAGLNEDARRRYHAQPEEKKSARMQQCVDYARERFQTDPDARARKNDYQNTRRASIPLRDHRASNLKRTYGITHEDYDRMLAEQGGGCAICGSTTPRTKRSEYLYVDHCHGTGAVRGLLCGPCNSGIGSLGDNIGRLEAAILYLKRHELGTAAS